MTTSAPPRSLPADRGRLPAPVRDRRPALAALAVLLVLGGALGSALIAYRSGDRVDVLVASRTIEVGQVLVKEDFGIARVASDDAQVIEAAARDNFLGSAALGRIPAGTLLNSQMFLSAAGVVPPRALVVGVVLGPTQRPAEDLKAGDVVRVFLVPRESTEGSVGTVLASAVRVAEVGTAAGDSLRLSLLVPEDGATTALVAAASTGSIAVSRLAPDTLPAIDFRTE